MTDAEMMDGLDGYGHLSYTVGNEDWLACGDFNVFNDPERGLLVAYHIVVDCESAGFVDTPEQGVVAVAELADDWCPLWGYADSCAEMYCGDSEYGTPDAEEVSEVCTRWVRDLRAAILCS